MKWKDLIKGINHTSYNCFVIFCGISYFIFRQEFIDFYGVEAYRIFTICAIMSIGHNGLALIKRTIKIINHFKHRAQGN